MWCTLWQGSPVEVLYIDNLETMYRVWWQVLHGQEPSDNDDQALTDEQIQEVLQDMHGIVLKQDVYHFFDRYSDSTAGPGNGLYHQFVTDLVDAVLLYHVPDVMSVIEKVGLADVGQLIKAIRKTCKR
jgi:hypothetical protein